MMMDTTVTILNWKRPDNLNRRILPALDRNPRVAEVFVVNNNCSDSGLIMASEKVRVFDIGRDHGLDARFAVAYFARTPLLFVQDDDLVVSPEAMDRVLDASLADERIHGFFGRRPTHENRYALYLDRQVADAEVVLTRALACRRRAVDPFFALREAEPVMRARGRHGEYGTNPENGEDIIFSYALRAANEGRLHEVHAAPEEGIEELPQYGVAQHANRRFHDHRTEILRACQEATGMM